MERTRTVQAIEVMKNQPAPREAQSSSEFSGFAFMTGDYQIEEDESGEGVTFILDSGASDHMINREDLFSTSTLLPSPFKISIAKMDQFVSATKKGTLNVVSDMGVPGVLEDVLFCPEVPYNLLSVSKMKNAGLSVVFDQQGAHVFGSDGKKMITGKCKNNLFYVCLTIHSQPYVSHVCK
jgi:hypothetical protein